MSSGKLAYVTGGMGGIGTAICQRLATDGFRVVAGCGPSRNYQQWLDEQAALGYTFYASAGNVAPIANAGADKSVNTGSLVTLDGRGSSDPDNGPQALSYSWSQIAGTAVTLSGATTSQPSFTPAAAGSYTFRLTVSDGALTSTDDIVVTATTGSNRIALPGRIQAEDYNVGGEGVGYHDLSAGNTGGQYRTDNVDIEATTDAGGGYNVGWIDAAEWLQYDVSVATAGTYNLTARVASASAGTKTLSVSVDGGAAINFSFTDASGWQSWKDVLVSGVSLAAGNHTIRFTMATGGFNLNYVDVTAGGSANLLANGDFANGIVSWNTYFASPATGSITNSEMSRATPLSVMLLGTCCRPSALRTITKTIENLTKQVPDATRNGSSVNRLSMPMDGTSLHMRVPREPLINLHAEPPVELHELAPGQQRVVHAHLHALLRPGMKVTVAIDDISMPLPIMRTPDVRQLVLEIVCEMLADHGVDDVHLIIALALHRRMTDGEIKRMVGEKI